MDPEMLRLLASLVSGKGGASRTDLEEVITNPMFALLLGGYNPMALVPQEGSGGELWSRYSQSTDPDMAVVLETIRSGGDKYQLEQAIDSIIAEAPAAGRAPFQEFGAMPAERLKSLAEDLRKEYQEPSKKSRGLAGQLEEWGFTNPLEQYSYETAPLTTTGSQLRNASRAQMQMLEERKAQTEKALAKAKADFESQEKLAEDYSVAMNKEQKRSGWQSLPGISLAFEAINEGLKVGEDIYDRARGKTNVKQNPKYEQAKARKREAQKADVQALIALRQQKANEEAFKRGLDRAIVEKGGSPFQAEMAQRLAAAQFLRGM